MKLISLIALLMILNVNSLTAQVLTFDEVQNLRANTLDEVENYLLKRNWQMFGSKQASGDQVGKVVFGYYKDGEAATIVFYLCDMGNACNRISIEVFNINTYKDYVSRLNTLNYKAIETKIIDDGIETIYQNKTTTCDETTTRFKPDANTNIPAYKFVFIDNYTYKLLDQ